MMVWFEVTGFGPALTPLTGTWTTLLSTVSLGSVARHVRARSSISASSKENLRGSSSLSWLISSVPVVVFGGPKTVVVVVVLVVAEVVVGTVSFPVVTVLCGCRLCTGESSD